jgi:hypothetical protein
MSVIPGTDFTNILFNQLKLTRTSQFKIVRKMVNSITFPAQGQTGIILISKQYRTHGASSDHQITSHHIRNHLVRRFVLHFQVVCLSCRGSKKRASRFGHSHGTIHDHGKKIVVCDHLAIVCTHFALRILDVVYTTGVFEITVDAHQIIFRFVVISLSVVRPESFKRNSATAIKIYIAGDAFLE